MTKKTLLLVFIHGFKGTDHTFHNFPSDLRALLAHTLPKIDVVNVTYPQYETRGDLKECVGRFKEWLQNKVIDLEVANRTPSPTVDPSVHVVLCGHSMGGIVAAETLLSVARDEPVAASTGYANDTTNNSTTTAERSTSSSASRGPTNLAPPEEQDGGRSTSAPPPQPDPPAKLFFPYIQAILAFDTPYLGISPGVLAHGAEEQINHASSAYKAFDSASQLFGWKSPGRSSTPVANSSAKALPAADGSTGSWNKWGKYAAIGGAAAAVAGAAGAAYLNRNQISQGFAWAGSHLEFVGCLARGAELQKRVESVVELERTRRVGFADFYTALGEKVTSQSKYAGSVLGSDRTFCVVPKDAREAGSPTGSKRDAPRQDNTAGLEHEMDEGKQVRDYAHDLTKSKGLWVKCCNEHAGDEVSAHTAMFSPNLNPDYHSMLPRARDQIADWVDRPWYESSMDPESQHPDPGDVSAGATDEVTEAQA